MPVTPSVRFFLLAPATISRNARLSRATVALLVYMICNLPKCVLVFIRLVQESSEELCQPGSQGIQEYPRNTQEAAEWVVSVFNIANSAVNFILYSLLGQRFRKEFTRLFCRCSTCIRLPLPNRYHTQSTAKAQSTVLYSQSVL